MNRLVALAFHGPPPSPRHHAAHRNGIRDDNRAENIYWATPAENYDDRRRHGTAIDGLRNPAARVTPEQAALICEQYATGMSERAVAQAHGVSTGTVSNIVTGKHWTTRK